jgi:hypothetical protein
MGGSIIFSRDGTAVSLRFCEPLPGRRLENLNVGVDMIEMLLLGFLMDG